MTDFLTDWSNALSARAALAHAYVVAIRISRGRIMTGALWSADTVVTSEQSLPDQESFAITHAHGEMNARVAGRDDGSNVAVLRLAQPLPDASIVASDALVGAVVIAYGADGAGGATARLGIVNTAGPEWVSLAGGRIDRRIVLDMRLSAAEEGGPVHDASGNCIGITTFGPHRQVLVIPTATVNRVVPALLDQGRVARGWLGIALQPVALPDALRDRAGQSTGLMVMSLADGGPASRAGVIAGDIVVGMNGVAASRFRNLARQLGPDSIGRTAELRLIRGGSVMSLEATIEASRA